jgi:hypothetical protein
LCLKRKSWLNGKLWAGTAWLLRCLRFPRFWCCSFRYYGLLRRVAGFLIPDVSEECTAFIFKGQGNSTTPHQDYNHKT